MRALARVLDALTTRAEGGAAGYRAQVTPPSRDGAGRVSVSEAAALPAAHRALAIIATAASQLSLDVERGGSVLTGSDVPAIIRRPSLDMTRSEWVSQVTLSLAGYGNAYVLREGGAPVAETVSLTPLPPYLVTPWTDEAGRVHYSYDGRDYGPDRVRHLRYLTLPGQLLGIGPLAAAQSAMSNASAIHSYSRQWWDAGQPAGILTSSQPLTAADARLYRNAWNLLDEDGNPLPPSANPSRVRVLGKDLSYTPLLINPKDSLWLEAQGYNTLEVARVFGVPSTLMLATPEGGSMTYSNVEQEWIGFVRFTLMAYLRAIEDALSDLTPRGQTVRFNVEALLRTDTASRYAAHRTALEAGFMTVDEVRAIEGLPPLSPSQAPPPAPLTQTQEVPA